MDRKATGRFTLRVRQFDNGHSHIDVRLVSSVTHTHTPTDHWITYFGNSSTVHFHLHEILGPNGSTNEEFDGEFETSTRREDEDGNIQPGSAWGSAGTYDETNGSLDYGQAANPDLNYNLGGSMYPFYNEGLVDPMALALSLSGVLPPAAPMADPVSTTAPDGEGGYWIISKACRTAASSLPAFNIASASRSFRTICSGLCRLRRFVILSLLALPGGWKHS